MESKENANKLQKIMHTYEYKNIHTRKAATDAYYELKQKEKTVSEDTQIRCEIHDIIERMLSEGKGKIEILTYLNNTFPNHPRLKCFTIWIDDQIKKFKPKIKENSGEERE